MATLPANLQAKITRTGFKEVAPDNVIRTPMEFGPDKVRKRTSANVRAVSVSMFLTDDEVDDLDDFYEANDALRFDMTHPRTQLSVEARFVNPPSYTARETHWDVSLELEILP